MWRAEDVAWLREYCPGLKRVTDDAFEGELSFRMVHKDGNNVINPTAQDFATLANPTFYISDTYKIKVEWRNGEMLPSVYDLSGRIVATAGALEKSLIDMHLMPDGSFCLGSWQDIVKSFSAGFSSRIFITEYLVPFLYAQTFYARQKIWPWGELSHGQWGLLEWLGRLKDYQLSDIKLTTHSMVKLIGLYRTDRLLAVRCRGHKSCPCGSGRKNWHCHPDAKNGIAILRGSLARKEIKLPDFYS